MVVEEAQVTLLLILHQFANVHVCSCLVGLRALRIVAGRRMLCQFREVIAITTDQTQTVMVMLMVMVSNSTLSTKIIHS